MDHFRILSGTEQTAAYLKQALRQGYWTGTIPGGNNQIQHHLLQLVHMAFFAEKSMVGWM